MKIHYESYLAPIIWLLVLSTPISAQLPLCTSDDINNMDVHGCTCPTEFPQPAQALTCFPNGPLNPQACPIACGLSPPNSPVTPRAQLNTCYSGCVDDNDNCNGCYIWFHSLCGCIHDFQSAHGTTCISSSSLPSPPITPGQPWNPV